MNNTQTRSEAAHLTAPILASRGLFLLLTLAGVCGCATAPAGNADTRPTASSNPASGTVDISSHKDAGGNLGVSGSGTYGVQPDPKRPGKYLWKIWASGFTIENPSAQITGSLYNVSAILFQAGAPASDLHAPYAVGDYLQRTITATGGVTVNSLSEPGTSIRADKVVWYANTGKLIATGHVVYRNGKRGTVIDTPEVVGDTVLKTIHSNAGGTAVFSKGL